MILQKIQPQAFFLKGDGPDMKAHCANGPYAMARYRPPLPGASLS